MQDADGYVHSTKFETEYLFTPEELVEEPYPWNLHTLCTDFYTRDSDETFKFHTPSAENENPSDVLPCRVLNRVFENEEYTYTVEIQTTHDSSVIAHGYPRDNTGIQLYDKAYSPMWHMKEAFRHKMFVPDDLFPKNWMSNQE